MNKRIVLIILFIYLLGIIAIFSSCTSVKKLRSNVHQETVKTETVNKSYTKDSTSKTITKTIDSSGITVTVVYDSTGTDTTTDFDITIYQPDKDQYFDRLQPDRIQIKSSVKPKSITVNQAKKKQAERVDSVSAKSAQTTDVKKEEKVVSKIKTVDKKKFKVPVTLMIIIIAAIIALIVAYKYRKQIKLFIIKLPFKFLP